MIVAHEIISFQKKILAWYGENKREGLPRRDSGDPYKVLVSEVMLQQTQVDRVIPKFENFIKIAPTIEVLSKLDNQTLLSLRSGLGFNSRVIRLQKAAQIILEKFGGVVPKTREELRFLPGIGVYSSASILAFAYNIPAPVVDTNIRRVFIYELGVDIETPQKGLEAIAFAVTPEGLANDWNNALMDYGSQVVTVAATGIKPLSKQSKFVGSKRQVRGNIIKYLLNNGFTTIPKLKKEFIHESFDRVVEELLKEGLVKKKGKTLYL